MKNKYIADLVENGIAQMFVDVATKYKLKTGDFAPEQDNELDDIQDGLYMLLVAYINQNKEA